MNLAVLFVALTFAWAAITGGFSGPNLLLGALVAWGALYLLRDKVARPAVLGQLARIASLAGTFVYELFVSAIRVADLVLRPDMKARLCPAIIAFPLTATRDGEITLLANLITLTHGTLSVDVSEDRKFLYIHALNCPDREALIRETAQGFERKVIEVFR